MALHLGLGIQAPRYTLLTTYETTEPPIERRYLLCGGTLQKVIRLQLTSDSLNEPLQYISVCETPNLS